MKSSTIDTEQWNQFSWILARKCFFFLYFLKFSINLINYFYSSAFMNNTKPHQKSWNVKMVKGKVHINLFWQRIPYFYFLECISNLSWCHRKHGKKKKHTNFDECRIQKRYFSVCLQCSLKICGYIICHNDLKRKKVALV